MKVIAFDHVEVRDCSWGEIAYLRWRDNIGLVLFSFRPRLPGRTSTLDQVRLLRHAQSCHVRCDSGAVWYIERNHRAFVCVPPQLSLSGTALSVSRWQLEPPAMEVAA